MREAAKPVTGSDTARVPHLCRLVLIVLSIAWAMDTARLSFAQMGYQANSLEWLVAGSDVVVRASVAAVEQFDPLEQRVWKTVTLKVHETLKGKHAEPLKFIEQTLASNRIYEGWRDAGRAQLWFLVRPKPHEDEALPPVAAKSTRDRLHPYGGGWSVIRLGPPIPEERGFSPRPPPIFSLNLTVLEKPDEILRAARAAAVQGDKPGRALSHAISLPHEIMQRSGQSGDANHLTVPIDGHLEALARRLIESPEAFLPSGDKTSRAWLRREGARALGHFRSERNITLLRSLLDDPAYSIHISPNGREEKVYDVREAAYNALQAWNITTRKPLLREAR